jgi:hypothetical protein
MQYQTILIRMAPMWFRLKRAAEIVVLVVLCTMLLSASTELPGDEQERARAYTRDIEFDYLSWMLDAALVKAQAAATGLPGYLDRSTSRIVVSDYLQVTAEIIRYEDALNRIYADPTISDKNAAALLIRKGLQNLNLRQGELAPLAEAVLQSQVSEIAADFGLATLGEPLPAVLYHSTSVPDALVVSPRTQIRQSANISIHAGLPIDQQTALERRVEKELDASALVVPVGGVGIYPTMIMRTADRHWLADTIAHEWTHNYLELRPLGLLYDRTPELRTMNETTADIVGTEIGDEVIRQFYSGMGSKGLPDTMLMALPGRYPDPTDADPPPFVFRNEMHTTRVTVDLLLASGRIIEAENYMEQRRRLFVEHGFFIRRLNQAYFAFYGAYAEAPGGPAGKDPVGPAVRALRARSSSLADFVNRIAWMTSFEDLQRAVGP